MKKYKLTLNHTKNGDIPNGYWEPPQDPPELTEEADALEEAATRFEAWRDRNGLGGGNMTTSTGQVHDSDGKLVGRFSYNGSFWNPDGSLSNAKEPRPFPPTLVVTFNDTMPVTYSVYHRKESVDEMLQYVAKETPFHDGIAIPVEALIGLRGTLLEVRAEITRLNVAAQSTIFNPAITAMVDELLANIRTSKEGA